MVPIRTKRKSAQLALILISPSIRIAIVAYTHGMTVFLALTAAHLHYSEVILGEEGHFRWLLDKFFCHSSPSLLPNVIAPGE